jgi:hypothetical protein
VHFPQTNAMIGGDASPIQIKHLNLSSIESKTPNPNRSLTLNGKGKVLLDPLNKTPQDIRIKKFTSTADKELKKIEKQQ